MQLNTLSAARGWTWLRDGIALYRRNPFGLMANVVLMWFVLMFAGLVLIPLLSAVLPREAVSWLSQLPLALLLPPLSVGIFNACRLIDLGQPCVPGTVFTGLQRNLKPLLVLGAIYYVGSIGALALANLLDDGLLLDVMRNPKRLDEEGLDSFALARSALVLLLLTLPAMMANWFAPLLVGLRNIPPVKAAFFSVVACWRNMRAFTTFGLALMGLFWLLPMLVGSLLMMVSPALAVSAVVVIPMMFAPALYAAFYANARDVLPDLTETDGGN